MRAFSEFIRNIPREYVPRVEETLSEAVRIFGDPSATEEHYNALATRLDALQHRVGTDTLRALEGELREQLERRWREAARAGIDIPRYVPPGINDLLRRAEGARARIASGRWLPSNLGTAAAGAFAILVGVVFLGSVDEGRQIAASVQNAMNQAQSASAIIRAQLSPADFEGVANRIRAPVGAGVPASALPPAVAALADQPVAVAIEPRDAPVETYILPFADFYDRLPRRVQEDVTDAIPPPPPASETRRTCTRQIDVKSEVGRFRSSVTLSC